MKNTAGRIRIVRLNKSWLILRKIFMETTPMNWQLPEPLPHQLPILESPARKKIVICGRKWGKTPLGMIACLQGHGPQQAHLRGAIDGGNIAWVAPNFTVASDIWRDLKRACAGNWLDKSEAEHRLDFHLGGVVRVCSADNPDSLRGPNRDGIVIDEAAFVSHYLWTHVLRPQLSATKGWWMFLTSPNGMNWIHDEFKKASGDPQAERWQRSARENPLLAPEEIEELRLDMGPRICARDRRVVCRVRRRRNGRRRFLTKTKSGSIAGPRKRDVQSDDARSVVGRKRAVGLFGDRDDDGYGRRRDVGRCRHRAARRDADQPGCDSTGPAVSATFVRRRVERFSETAGRRDDAGFETSGADVADCADLEHGEEDHANSRIICLSVARRDPFSARFGGREAAGRSTAGFPLRQCMTMGRTR